MNEGMDGLGKIPLPRVRGCRMLNPMSYDGRGNYAIGSKERSVFPEINCSKAEQV